MKKTLPVRAAYLKLRDGVKNVLLLGQKRVEIEKVRTYWRAGRLIHEHLLLNDGRSAHYGHQVIRKLSSDLGVSPRLLWQCVQFARTFKITNARALSSRARLTWTHYRKLMTIPDENSRFSLAHRAEKSQWTTDQLSQKIRLEFRAPKTLSSAEARDFPNLIPKRGEIYTYRLISPESPRKKGGLWIDMGFQVKRRLPKASGKFKENQIVESKKSGETYSVSPSKRGEAALFTYSADVERVVDGDTLLVHIDLGFDTGVRQYLRLRGLDGPELETPEGKKAKAFVEKELAESPRIVLASSRSDKYDRYLADVFYESGEGEKYLNQVLLDRGMAVRME